MKFRKKNHSIISYRTATITQIKAGWQLGVSLSYTSAAKLYPKKLLATLALFWGPRFRAAAAKHTPRCQFILIVF